MPSPTKLATLTDLRFRLSTGQIKDDDAKLLKIADTDGSYIPLSDPNALAVLDRRIAAEQPAR